jgi:SulP family sulfate permease
MTDVVHLGVSAALAIEEAVLDMIRAGRAVYIVAVPGQPRQRLENMGVLQCLPAQNVVEHRLEALEGAAHGGTAAAPVITASADQVCRVG